MKTANLYQERIDYCRYLKQDSCTKCGSHGCRELIERLQSRTCLHSDWLSRDEAARFEQVFVCQKNLPEVPMLTVPRPVMPALVGLNQPAADSDILVSGNNEFTQQVLMTVLSECVTPLWVLFSDTRGDTVDMAMILGSMTATRILGSLCSEGGEEKAPAGSLVLPGLAAPLAPELAELSGRRVQVGPLCAAELPLFLGERWVTVK